MPAPRAVTVDPAGLDTLGEGTRQPEPDPSSFWDPDLTPSSAELLDAERLADQPKAFSIALPSEGRIPEMLWMFEEVDERLCEILQSLLLHHAGSFSQPWVLGTGGGQLSALVHEVDGTAPWLPPRALLESEVVHEPGVRTMSAQDRLLHDCRVHAVSVTHESFEHTERVGQGSCRPGPATVTGWRVHRTWSPAPAAPAAAALAVAVAAVAPVRLLLEHPEHDEHLPGFGKKCETKKPPPWREAVTANSGAGSAPHGAFPPGSAKLEMADGTARPRR